MALSRGNTPLDFERTLATGVDHEEVLSTPLCFELWLPLLRVKNFYKVVCGFLIQQDEFIPLKSRRAHRFRALNQVERAYCVKVNKGWRAIVLMA